MIACHRNHLAARCRQRGYTLEEVRECIVRQDGNQLLVDPSHPAYPRMSKPGFEVETLPFVQPGPGAHLKRLLGRIGITASPTCSCNARAAFMDAQGCEWCEAHLDEIVGWLREEATKRGLPFLDAVGKLLVRRAISNARKEQPHATETKDGSSGKASSAV